MSYRRRSFLSQVNMREVIGTRQVSSFLLSISNFNTSYACSVVREWMRERQKR